MDMLLNTKGLVITFYQNVRRAGFKVSERTRESMPPSTEPSKLIANEWPLKAQEKGELSEDVHLRAACARARLHLHHYKLQLQLRVSRRHRECGSQQQVSCPAFCQEPESRARHL